MDTFWQDVKYGLRKLAKNPGFTAVSLIVLALGIGANTAIFSVVNAVLLKPLAYAEPDRLVILWETAQKMDTSVAYPNFVDMRDRQTSFDRFAAFRRESFNMTGTGEPERLQGRMVSSDFFSAFGVPLYSGRDFTPEDDRPGAGPVVILSYDFWQRRFGGDESVVGRQLTLNDRVYTVVGVAGKSFKFGAGADLFAPLGLFADRYPSRGMHPGLYVIGKLKPGVSLEKGRADLDGIFAALNEQFPDQISGRRSHVESLYENTVSDVRNALWILLGAVTFVLLIACANVANLQLARAATRHREIALRAALGAGRARIVRQLLTENIVLSIAGGLIGLLLAVWGTSALITLLPEGIPRIEDVRVDAGVLAFTFAISVLTGVVFGLVPAFAVSKPDVNDALKEGERGSTGGRHRVRSALVVSEIALALVLLVGAGLMIRSIWGLQRVNLGFDSGNLLTVNLSMTVTQEQADKAKGFIDQLEQRLKTIPGAEAAAVTGGLPFVGAPEDSYYLSKEAMNEPDAEKMAVEYAVTPGYKDALGIKVLRGRFLAEADRSDTARVAVVDESFVEKYYDGEDPVGKYLYNNPDEDPAQIVGVVGHVKHYGIDGQVPVEPQVYIAISQMPAMAMPFVSRNLGLLVRTHQDPLSLTAAVRDQVRALDANQPIFSFRTMDDIVASSLAARRFSMFVLAVFAVVALLLAGVGIYGVMAYSTEQRTHEVGIRMALGARGRDVLWMILRQGIVLAAIGLATGVAAALALTRVMSSLLFSVSATDPATFGTVAAILAAVALAACLIPARRATRVDPMRALRHE